MKTNAILSAALGSALVMATPFAMAQEPAAAQTGAVLYANDFSARSGASAVPSGRWRGSKYALGTVAYNYPNLANGNGTYAWSDGLAWADTSRLQDGWVLSGNGTWTPGASVVVNSESERPGDTESPFLAFSINNSQYYTSRASQPIGNSFTNGVVEYWVDMRAPGKWGNTSSMPYLRFIPIYRTYLQTPDNTVNPPVAYPAMLGPCNLTGSAATASTTRCFGGSQYNGDLGVVSAADGGYVSLRTGWWYRYRLVVDFESHYVYYSVWELGANVPTWDTPAGENVMPQKRKYVYRPPTAETGPLDGIGFAVGGINSGNPSVVTNMAAVTNIRVGWKAHDADAEFIPCYSNDFRTCWRRSLADATTASAYAAPAGAGASEFSSYYANVNTTCPGSQVITGTTGQGAQPVGVDGWRRISETGAAHPSVANSGGDGANVLRVTKASGTASSAYWAVFGNSLGETITSGKVMFSVDVRTADKWYSDAARLISVALSDSFCYSSGVNSTYGPHRATTVGLRGAGETDTPYAWYVDNSATVNDTAARGAARTWHRIVTVADLDAKTYDFTVSNLGEAAAGKPADYDHAGASVILARSGVPIRSGVTDISSFTLLAYSVGDTWNGAVLFDNIQVWKIPTDGATTNLVYYNDFNVRRRTGFLDAPRRQRLRPGARRVVRQRLPRDGGAGCQSRVRHAGHGRRGGESQGRHGPHRHAPAVNLARQHAGRGLVPRHARRRRPPRRFDLRRHRDPVARAHPLRLRHGRRHDAEPPAPDCGQGRGGRRRYGQGPRLHGRSGALVPVRSEVFAGRTGLLAVRLRPGNGPSRIRRRKRHPRSHSLRPSVRQLRRYGRILHARLLRRRPGQRHARRGRRPDTRTHRQRRRREPAFGIRDGGAVALFQRRDAEQRIGYWQHLHNGNIVKILCVSAPLR